MLVYLVFLGAFPIDPFGIGRGRKACCIEESYINLTRIVNSATPYNRIEFKLLVLSIHLLKPFSSINLPLIAHYMTMYDLIPPPAWIGLTKRIFLSNVLLIVAKRHQLLTPRLLLRIIQTNQE